MTITKEGSLASFYTVNKAPIKHLRVYFSPKQTGEGDPSPENVRPIEGWNSINVHTAGKNLIRFPIMTRTYAGITWTSHSDGSINIDGTCTGDYAFMSNWNDINYHLDFYLKAGTYKLSGNNSNIAAMYFVARDGSTTKDIGSLSPHYTYSTFTLAQDTLVGFQVAVRKTTGEIHTTFYPQLELVEKTEYEKPRYNTYNLNWSNDIGTVYGGYVDLITGELWKTYDIAHLNDPDRWVVNPDATSTYRYNERFERKIITNDSYSYTLCTIAKVAFLPGDKYGRWNGWNDKRFMFSGTFSNEYTLDQVKQWASENKITISYLLNTPQLITTLSPLQLQTFIGQNNIWSNADRVEVEYDLAESNDELYRRRNIILQSAPHLETVSGNIANFSTDVAAPIKDAKIYFNPIQLGSGEPNPENVREISGWQGLNTYITGENLVISSEIISNAYVRGAITQSGTEVGSVVNLKGWCCTDFIKVLPNTVYTIAFSWANASAAGLAFYENNIITSIISGISMEKMKSSPYTFTTPNNCNYLRFSAAQNDTLMSLTQGNISLSEQNYTSNIFNTNWTSNGTIYGGYVDLISGNVYKIWEKVTLTEQMTSWGAWGTKLAYNSSYMWSGTAAYTHGTREAGSIIYSNILTPVGGTVNPQQVTDISEIRYYGVDTRYPQYLFMANPNELSINDWRAWFSETYPDAYIIYKLAIPKYITTLTSQQLLTFRGTNNIWSTANGQTEITYWTH